MFLTEAIRSLIDQVMFLTGAVMSLIDRVMFLIGPVRSLIDQVMFLIGAVRSLIDQVMSCIKAVKSCIGAVQSCIRTITMLRQRDDAWLKSKKGKNDYFSYLVNLIFLPWHKQYTMLQASALLPLATELFPTRPVSGSAHSTALLSRTKWASAWEKKVATTILIRWANVWRM